MFLHVSPAIAQVPVLSCVMFSETNTYHQDDRPHRNRNVLALDFVPLCWPFMSFQLTPSTPATLMSTLLSTL